MAKEPLVVTLDNVDALSGISADVTLYNRPMQLVYVKEKEVLQLYGVRDLGEALMILNLLQRTNHQTSEEADAQVLSLHTEAEEPGAPEQDPAETAQAAADDPTGLTPFSDGARLAWNKIAACVNSTTKIDVATRDRHKRNLNLLLRNNHVSKVDAESMEKTLDSLTVAGPAATQDPKPSATPPPKPQPAVGQPQANGARIGREISGQSYSLLESLLSAASLQTAVDAVVASGYSEPDQVVAICKALQAEIPGLRLAANLDKRIRMRLTAQSDF